MKLRVYLLSLVLIPLALFSENISLEKAKEIGLTFMRSSDKLQPIKDLRMVYDGETPASRNSGAAPAFYVFNNPDGKGFVIVSGDDIAIPVLGYSTDNNFPSEIPSNVEAWLESMKDEINDAREKGITSSRSASSDNAYLEPAVKQLKTAKWNQGAPYNEYTPTIGGKHTPTGCVITATAIVMKYHQWPQQGEGTLLGYTTSTGIEIPKHELGHIYDWDMMPNEYIMGAYTKDQAHQVAQLMYDLGVMLRADYAIGGTGAITYYINSMLEKCMDYDKSAIELDRHDYTTADWTQLMINELNEDRPIIYSGFNENAGHAFVLDGYTSNHYFSVNWGWGGYCNGFFKLNALYPSGSGIGGNDDHYNYDQAAVIGLKKDEGGDYTYSMGIGTKGLSTTTTDFLCNEPFILQIDHLSNKGNGDFTGAVLFALTDKAGNIKEELNKFSFKNLKPGWGWYDYKIQLTITQTIEIGDCIRLYYKASNQTEWTLIKGGDDCIWEIPVADAYSIEETTQFNYNKSTQRITLKTKDGVLVELSSENGAAIESTAGENANEIIFDTQGLPAGTYTLKLSKKYELKEIKLKLGQSEHTNP